MELHDHLIRQADDSEEEVHMIVGQISAQLLLEEIRPAQVEVRQPWILPNFKIYRNPLMDTLSVAGGLGIQEEMIDIMFPTLYPHKETWKWMKELVKQGNNNGELSKLLNEQNEESTMMVGEAFSLRDQMVCSQKDLLEIYEYISMYHTEESEKEEPLEDESTERCKQVES